MICYKTPALSVTLFAGQFFEPPSAAFRLEDECLQLLVNGPRHAIPRSVFFDFAGPGIKFRVPQLRQVSMVA
eukprot:1777236-Pyramimonas_sp.AAC.1